MLLEVSLFANGLYLAQYNIHISYFILILPSSALALRYFYYEYNYATVLLHTAYFKVKMP